MNCIINKELFLAAFFLLNMHSASLSAQTALYVSPQGKENGKGTLHSPFKTIEQALKKAQKCTGEVTIYLREGKYILTQPLILSAEDGNEHKHLTLRSYPGEKAIISSGAKLNAKWKRYTDNIWKTSLKEPLRMDRLLVNGKDRPMARFPNYDSTAIRFNGTSAEATSPQRIKQWEKPEGGYLHVMHASDWGDFHYRITGTDKVNGKLQLEGGWQNNRPSGLHPKNRMVENIFEELDAPGEWFFDVDESILYYYPLQEENIHALTFESPQLKHLVEMRGSQTKPIRHITLQDLTFTQTVRTFMEAYEPLLRSDWQIYRGGAVMLEGTEDCHVIDCQLNELGGNAIFFSNYNRHSSVSGCHIAHIGASAICFVGNPSAVRSPSFRYGQSVPLAELDTVTGAKNGDYPALCTAHDNLIHHIGRYEKQTTGVELSMCQSVTVSHNSIYNTPRAGINISEGTWGGHVIEFNDVFNTVLETGDHGAFNSWGRDRFWRAAYKEMSHLVREKPHLILADAIATTHIRFNRFRCDRGWDIDLDDGSSNYHIDHNLCLNGGIKLREGFYRTVENNVLVNCSFHPHVWFKNSGDVFVRNLVMDSYRPIGVAYWGTEIDYNLFTDSIAYKAARAKGTDAHSMVCAVSFKDAASGDFTVVEADKVNVACGFRNFDMHSYGVVSPRLKALAQRPVMPVPVIHGHQESGNAVFEWSGLSVKSLTTLGERSATGMDSERGVYVVSSHVMGNPLKEYIRSNDVIIGFNNRPVNKWEDLKAAVREADLSGPIVILLFRNQQELPLTLPGNTIKK